MNIWKTYYSDRGIPLLLNYEPTNQPIVTVENYMKWYSLYLVQPDGTVSKLSFDEAAERSMREAAYSDHCFNPIYAVKAATNAGAYVQEEALEMIVGRWRLEILEDDYGQ